MKAACATFVVATISALVFFFGLPGAARPIDSRRDPLSEGQDQIRVVHGIGFIEPEGEVRRLTFRGHGVIRECNVEPGQRFSKDDVLATLIQDDEKAAAEVASRSLEVARADRDRILAGTHPAQVEAAGYRVRKLQETLQYLKGAHRREVVLSDKNASTVDKLELAAMSRRAMEEELREAEADQRYLKSVTRQEEIDLANSQVLLAEAKLREAQVRLDRTILYAPTDGSVLEVVKRPGEAVLQLDSTPVIIFADISQLLVRAEIDERYVNSITEGAQTVVKSRGLANREYSGKVVRIQPLMGKKQLFSREASEKKDIEVFQVFIRTDESLSFPVGLKVDVEIIASVKR